MLVLFDWLNVLFDGGENKVISFMFKKYDYAATQLYTKGDANIKNSHGRK